MKETVACPKCNWAKESDKTVGVDGSKYIQCPNCGEYVPLNVARAAGGAKTTTPHSTSSPTPNPPSPNPSATPPLPPATAAANTPANVPGVNNTPQAAAPNAVTPPQSQSVAPATNPQSPAALAISNFANDGQNHTMVLKLVQRIQEICTRSETPMYMAIQQKLVVNVAPDAVVLTNRRMIIFRQKILWRMEFVDYPWLYVRDVHVKEDFIGATMTMTGTNGNQETVEYLPKAQARKIYRIAQEMEERMIEVRRQRSMEEDRNRAGQFNVNIDNQTTPGTTPSHSSPDADPVTKLQQLKAMLDAGLISQAEFDQKKQSLLNSI